MPFIIYFFLVIDAAVNELAFIPERFIFSPA
jgi:hypothetical protein